MSARPGADVPYPKATEARKPDTPGRARYKPSNHCAGNVGCPPLNLYARVRFLFPFCTRDRGCSAHPAFPAPSDFKARNFLSKPRADRAARTRSHAHQTSLRVGTGGRHRPALDESLRLDVGSMTPFLSDFLPRSEATKQSILPLRGEMDCFASLAMT